jgi:hypothetical protein
MPFPRKLEVWRPQITIPNRTGARAGLVQDKVTLSKRENLGKIFGHRLY